LAVLDSAPVAITPTCPPAGSVDCGGSEADASVDSATDASSDGGDSAAASDQATGCQLGASSAGSTLWSLALAGLFLGRRRARSRQR
jgi:hypothetical protein